MSANMAPDEWYAVWARVIARAWQDAAFRGSLLNPSPDAVLDLLQRNGFLPDGKPANWPNITVQEIEPEEGERATEYLEGNAWGPVNGWAHCFNRIGGKATIVLPSRPKVEAVHAVALADYCSLGVYMPFKAKYEYANPERNVGGPRFSSVGNESVTDGLDDDGEWIRTFPILVSLAWTNEPWNRENGHVTNRQRLIQSDVEPSLRIKRLDALFRQVGYTRPIGLEIQFVDAGKDEGAEYPRDIIAQDREHVVWNIEALRPTLTMHLPPPPTEPFRAVALADFRGTGKAQLFTT